MSAVARRNETGEAKGGRPARVGLGLESPRQSLVRSPPPQSHTRTAARAPARICKVGLWTNNAPSSSSIDVSKDRLDVHLRPSGEPFLCSTRGQGDGRLGHPPPGTVCRPCCTRGDWRLRSPVAAALAGVEAALCVVNPRQIRRTSPARWAGLAKTDAASGAGGDRPFRAERDASRSLRPLRGT